MSRTKIAPMLSRIILPKFKYSQERGIDDEDWSECARELRALLAVARAAEHLVNEDRNRTPGTIHCSWLDACDRTQRALARLARASGRKP